MENGESLLYEGSVDLGSTYSRGENYPGDMHLQLEDALFFLELAPFT